MSPTSVEALDAEIKHVGQRLTLPSPLFPLTVGWTTNYDSLLEGLFPSTTGIDHALDESLKRGRLLIHGEGGSGKTVGVMRLFAQAAERGMVPVLVSLRKWQAPISLTWKAYSDNDYLRMQMLLRELGEPQLDESLLSQVPPDRWRVVLVDGLSEVPSTVSEEVLQVLDAFAQRNPSSVVIATDRVVRRPLPSRRWGLGAIKPMPAEQIREILHSDAADDVIPTAFFVDLALNRGLDSTSSSAAFAKYFAQVGIKTDQMDGAARAAFELYGTQPARTFPLNDFQSLAGTESTQSLIETGVLSIESDKAYFRHHLFQDYLAARYLASNPQLWTNDSFDAVSLTASSFEALGMTLEQVEDPVSSDELLRRIYDWSFYGSAYALAKGKALGSVRVTETMEVALLAMLAERRWDRIRHSAEWVEDALRLANWSDLASKLLAAQSLDDVVRIVEDVEIEDDRFQAWRKVYTTQPGSEATGDIVQLIGAHDSLLGWTAANVLKRLRLAEPQAADLRAFANDLSPTVRWRVAHVLGAHPSRQNAEALIELLGDDYHWVRYGAVRSAIEMAAGAHVELRDFVLRELQTRLGDLIENQVTVQQVERALKLRNPPSDWPQAVTPLLEQLWVGARTVEQQDRWRRLAYEIEHPFMDS